MKINFWINKKKIYCHNWVNLRCAHLNISLGEYYALFFLLFSLQSLFIFFTKHKPHLRLNKIISTTTLQFFNFYINKPSKQDTIAMKYSGKYT